MKLLNSIGWLALVGIIFGANIAIKPKIPHTSQASTALFPTVSEPTTTTSRHHKISVTVTALEDLKIKPGDSLKQGTLISDRPQERRELQAKQQQLETEIHQLSLPLSPVTPAPPENFASEEIALRQAKLKLEQIGQNLDTGSQLQFKQPELSEIFEPEKIRHSEQLQGQQDKAHLDLEAAIAGLNSAQSRYRQQQHEYSLRLAEYRTRLQRQQYEVSLRKSQLQAILDQLQHTVAVRSPYSGKVHRIKVLQQQDRQITLEIILLVSNNP